MAKQEEDTSITHRKGVEELSSSKEDVNDES